MAIDTEQIRFVVGPRAKISTQMQAITDMLLDAADYIDRLKADLANLNESTYVIRELTRLAEENELLAAKNKAQAAIIKRREERCLQRAGLAEREE